MKKSSLIIVVFSILLGIHGYAQNKADCEIIKLATYCELLSNNKIKQTDTIIFQVNTRNGETYTEYSILYSKDDAISNIDGWIEDAHGNKIRSLKGSEIKITSATSYSALYSDNYYKNFQLKHNSYPYRIFYTYTRTNNQFFSIADWTPYYSSKTPTREAILKVSRQQQIESKSYLRDVKLTHIDSSGNTITETYSSKWDKVINTDELYSKPIEDIIPRAIIAPVNFYYGIEGSAETWQSYGNWFYNLNKDLLKLPEGEIQILHNLVNGITDTVEIIRVLFHYLQDHTRYIEVTMGIGGLKAFPASYVSANKYGDCKALTNYMMALLNVARIKSNFVLIYRDEQPKHIIEELPFPQFNHVILAVPLSNDTIWIENTGNNEPFNIIGADIQNRKALFIEENGSKLIDMPVYKKEECSVNRKVLIKFNPAGDAQAKIFISYKGPSFNLFNLLNSEYNQNEKDLAIRQYMPFENFEVINWELNKKDRDSGHIELISEVNLYKLLKPLGDELYFSSFPIFSSNFEQPNQRTLPVQISYPIIKTDSVIYTIPNNCEVKSFPENKLVSSNYGLFSVMFTLKENELIIVKRLELNPGIYSLNQYSDFYNFINSFKEIEKSKIILKKKII